MNYMLFINAIVDQILHRPDFLKLPFITKSNQNALLMMFFCCHVSQVGQQSSLEFGFDIIHHLRTIWTVVAHPRWKVAEHFASITMTNILIGFLNSEIFFFVGLDILITWKCRLIFFFKRGRNIANIFIHLFEFILVTVSHPLFCGFMLILSMLQ